MKKSRNVRKNNSDTNSNTKRDRQGGGVAYCIKFDTYLSTKNIISKIIEVIFVDLLLTKTRPISVGIVYKPSKHTSFVQLFAEILNSFNILENEMFAIGNININILQNCVNLLERKR